MNYDLPEKIPALESKRINQIDVWEPGKRVLSEIHRVGRRNNLEVIITLPISISERYKGLLVIVLNDQKQKERVSILLKPISEWISALLRNHQIYLDLTEKSHS
jgi:hypothetical protein